MDKMADKPTWGVFELIVAYFGVLVVGILFSLQGENWFDFVITHTSIAGSEINFFVFSFAIQFLAIIGLVFLLTTACHKTKARELGLWPGRKKDYFFYGILGGLFLLVIIGLMGYVINHFQPSLEPQPYEAMLRSVKGPGQFLAVFLVGAVFAPLSEELFYRGMMYPVFRYYFGPWGGAIIAGVIFGISHWDLWRTIPLAIGGALLCYIYEKSGSIYVSALAHGVWNGVMSIIIYVSLLAA